MFEPDDSAQLGLDTGTIRVVTILSGNKVVHVLMIGLEKKWLRPVEGGAG